MGNQSRTNPGSRGGTPWLAVLLWLVCLGTATGQVVAPLILPGGLAYDSAGNLYFAESGNHVVRRLTAGGVLTVIAGTGVQGVSGDGGAAVAARLDSPGAVAVDAVGNLMVTDAHNHRIRRVDAATGAISTVVGTGVAGLTADGLAASATQVDLPSALAFDAVGDLYYADARRQVVRRVEHLSGLVTTVAGNAVQGSQGDGGPAVAASLDSPGGLAVDAAGNVFVSDSHNQRVRRVDAISGVITTVAGTASGLSLPRGLVVDASGTLYIVDAGNQKIRRVDAATGAVTTIAGTAVEGFAGDGGPATKAALNLPRGVALAPGGLPTVTDAANGRVRQVDAAGVIRTIVGVGASGAPAGLQLAGPASVVYGSGSLTATLGGAAGSGPVKLMEGTTVISSAVLSGNVATFSVGSLGVGAHALQANFAGDAAHAALLSNVLQLGVGPAAVVATPDAVSIVYGTAVPALTGTLTGVFAQDTGQVQVSFSSGAGVLSGAGTYPIAATLSGSAAGNYALTTAPAAVTITKAASATSLSSSLLAHVASSMSGQPGGSVSLLDGNTLVATSPVSAAGDVQFASAALSNGTHTLTASYAGDANFFASNAAPVIVTIGPAGAADFSLAATGSSAVSVAAGTDAVFTFAMVPVNGSLSSPIALNVAGLPSGATASFNPALLPPGSGAATFTLTVHTAKMAGLRTVTPLLLAGLMVIFWAPKRWRRGVLACALIGLAGCGDRVNTAAEQGAVARTYNLTVTGTATSNAGAALVHSVPVTLTLQ